MATTTKKVRLVMPLQRLRGWLEAVTPFASGAADLPLLNTLHLREGNVAGVRYVVAEATDRYVYGAHRHRVSTDDPWDTQLTGRLEATIGLRHVRQVLAMFKPAPRRQWVQGGAKAELTFGATELTVTAVGDLAHGLTKLAMTVPLVDTGTSGYPDMAALAGRTWARCDMAPVLQHASDGMAAFAAVRPLDGDRPVMTVWGGQHQLLEDGSRLVGAPSTLVTVGDDFLGMIAPGRVGAARLTTPPAIDTWTGIVTPPEGS